MAAVKPKIAPKVAPKTVVVKPVATTRLFDFPVRSAELKEKLAQFGIETVNEGEVRTPLNWSLDVSYASFVGECRKGHYFLSDNRGNRFSVCRACGEWRFQTFKQ